MAMVINPEICTTIYNPCIILYVNLSCLMNCLFVCVAVTLLYNWLFFFSMSSLNVLFICNSAANGFCCLCSNVCCLYFLLGRCNVHNYCNNIVGVMRFVVPTPRHLLVKLVDLRWNLSMVRLWWIKQMNTVHSLWKMDVQMNHTSNFIIWALNPPCLSHYLF